MKRSFLLFVLFAFRFFLFPAAAQEPEYVITEAELIQLESISEHLQMSRQNLLLQANDLTERLKAQGLKASSLAANLQQAESTANSLNDQLQTERKILKTLRQSYNKFEQEAASLIAEQQAIIDKQKDKLNRRMITIIILSSVIIITIIAIGITYFIKGKLSFLLPP